MWIVISSQYSIKSIYQIGSSSHTMLAKFVSSIVLAFEVIIFAMLPYYYSKTFSNKKIINAFNNFSSGLFLGISFLHIIPQANLEFSNWMKKPNEMTLNSSFVHQQESHHHHQFPYGSLIALITFLLVFGLQVYMNDGTEPSQKNQSQKRNNIHMYQVLTSQKMKMRRRLMLQTYLTQLALSIHSLFQCMSIGVQKKQKVVMTLVGAIIFHKWAQALTLGFSYSVSGMPKQTAFKFATFHGALNAAAVIIGYQLSETSDLAKGITNGISGGTFIYITMIEKIGKDFGDRTDLGAKLGLIFSGLLFSLLILH